MLREPPPGDWLMYRRTYDGWGYSPLDQIDRTNVGRLRLAWVWSMEDGRNQPTPIVHDGVMFLANPRGVVQALDARTGTGLWEYRREYPEGFGGGERGMRNFALHGNRLVLSTADAAVIALDARTGELVWETQVADPALGYNNTAGPLVVRGKADQRHQRLQPVPAGQLLHHGARRGNRRRGLAHVHHRPPRRAGRRHLGRPAPGAARRRRLLDRRQLRPGARSALLGRGAGEAVGAGQPRADDRRRRAVHELHAGARPRHRRDRLVLPARAGRGARPGRGLREGARSTATAGGRSTPSASTASCGSWTARRARFSTTRRPSSRTSSRISIRRPAR